MKYLKWILLLLLMSGCAQPELSVHEVIPSDEHWYEMQDTKSVLIENVLTMISPNSDAIIQYHLKTDKKELWKIDNWTINSIAKDHQENIFLQIQQQETECSSIVQIDFNNQTYEKITDIQGTSFIDGNQGYWIENSILKEVNLSTKEIKDICNFTEIETNSERITPVAKQDHFIVLRHQIIASESADLIVVDLNNNTFERLSIMAQQKISSKWGNTFFKGADENSLYFWASGEEGEIHFTTDYSGNDVNINIIYKNNEIGPNSPVSQHGIYYGVDARQAGIQISGSPKLLVCSDGQKMKVISELVSCSETRSFPVEGFIRTVCSADDGTETIFLTQPQSGKQWLIHEEKITYYQQRQEEALDSLSDPIDFVDEHQEAASSPSQAGRELEIHIEPTNKSEIKNADELYYIQSGAYDDQGTFWFSAGGRFPEELYCLDSNNKAVKRADTNQLATISEDAFHVAEVDGKVYLYYYHIPETGGEYYDIYHLTNTKAELIMKDVSMYNLILSEHGAFYSSYSKYDITTLYPKETDSMIVYYQDKTGNRVKLAEFNECSLEMNYDEERKVLIVTKDPYGNEYYDLETYEIDLITLTIKNIY